MSAGSNLGAKSGTLPPRAFCSFMVYNPISSYIIAMLCYILHIIRIDSKVSPLYAHVHTVQLHAAFGLLHRRDLEILLIPRAASIEMILT